MNHSSTLGLTDFLAQTDAIEKAAIIVLLLMSLATWYFIVTKSVQILLVNKRSWRFLEVFWNAPSMQAVGTYLGDHPPADPFAHLTYRALVAVGHHARHSANKLDEAGTKAEFLTRAIRRGIDSETAQIERGLTVLASVGSTAPFVGLFGTVLGVYHALISIGITGQGTLDKVAGPVGEALVMTAFGLAVAIPAVLAYNAISRNNRLLLAQLDSFAHDLFSFLTTGVHLNDDASFVAERAPLSSPAPLHGAT